MRLVRLVAAGLVVGVTAGFVVALLRPRHPAIPAQAENPRPGVRVGPAGTPLPIDVDPVIPVDAIEPPEPASAAPVDPVPQPAANDASPKAFVLDVRSRRSVIG